MDAGIEQVSKQLLQVPKVAWTAILVVLGVFAVSILLPTLAVIGSGLVVILGGSVTLFVTVLLMKLAASYRGRRDLSGQLVVITGAGSGIGRLMAIKFAKEHRTNLALLDINEPGLESTLKAVKAANGSVTAHTYMCNVAERAVVLETFATLLSDFPSNDQVDILINNAGIVSGTSDITTLTEEHIRRTLDVNTIAHFWTLQGALKTMVPRNSGHIVTIASLAGMNGVGGLTDYCASKFGAVGLHESLRRDLRKMKMGNETCKIGTTLVCPFYINTGMFDGVTTSFPLLLPILDPEEVTDRIVEAVEFNKELVICPRLLGYSTMVLKFIFPCWIQDWICDVLGVSKSMDTFKGRGWKATEPTKKNQ